MRAAEVARPAWLVRSLGNPATGLVRFIRRKPLGAFGGLCILIMVAAAVLADVLAPYDPIAVHAGKRLTAPGAEFLMGTDELGRDVLSRVIYGARTSLYIGIGTVAASIALGTIVGMTSGYFGGKLDLIAQRFVDSIMPIPLIVLAMTLVSMLGASKENVIISLAIVLTPNNARIIRGATLAVAANAYIEAARAMGASSGRILVRHILPNIAAPILILASIQLGGAILVESSLSFLGAGTPPPTPTWGAMLSGSGRRFMETAPWLLVAPSVAISLAVLGFNLLGDALRDIWDPRLRGT